MEMSLFSTARATRIWATGPLSDTKSVLCAPAGLKSGMAIDSAPSKLRVRSLVRLPPEISSSPVAGNTDVSSTGSAVT